MNKANIMRIAQEAGFERLGHTDKDWVCYPEDIERFAELVAQHQREKDREQAVALLRQLHDNFSLESAELRIHQWASKDKQ